MRSVTPPPADSAPVDDRTAKARIRDAAIDCFAEYGVADTTARKVATAAGVSAGLVLHHFKSMEGLRVACDEHVAAVIRHYKDDALSTGPQLDLLAALREFDSGSMIGYLARVLTDDSAVVAKLVDNLVADAEVYLQHGVESGLLQPTDDPQARATVIALWSLGALVMHRHMKRLLGVDLTDPDITSDPALFNYMRPLAEIMGSGIYTEGFATQLKEALASPKSTTPEGN
jgi:AcrR family transcriptional regulator